MVLLCAPWAAFVFGITGGVFLVTSCLPLVKSFLMVPLSSIGLGVSLRGMCGWAHTRGSWGFLVLAGPGVEVFDTIPNGACEVCTLNR